jgi:hypothetical protein
MKYSSLLLALMLALAPAAFAKSPSSEGVSADEFFTGAAPNNGRDSGLHTGWCTAPGHPESQDANGNDQANAYGHRNHDHCDEEEYEEG